MLKREDLNHTGAHKINNVLGQALLAKRMGKRRIIESRESAGSTTTEGYSAAIDRRAETFVRMRSRIAARTSAPRPSAVCRCGRRT